VLGLFPFLCLCGGVYLQGGVVWCVTAYSVVLKPSSAHVEVFSVGSNGKASTSKCASRFCTGKS
jgi:hypothetical protein